MQSQLLEIILLILVVSHQIIFDFLHRILISTNAMQTRLGTAAPELLHFPNLTQWLKVGDDDGIEDVDDDVEGTKEDELDAYYDNETMRQ